MDKAPPKIPIMMLAVLLVLIIGLILIVRINGSTNTGTLKKVQEKKVQEKELYEFGPGDPSS